MNNIPLRFPHLMEQILQKLDNESLVKSRKVGRMWQKFIDQTKLYPWIHIVKIPTILKGGDTYLHLAAKYNQIDMFEMIIDDEYDANLLNDEGYTPFHVACLHGRVKIAEFMMKKSAELNIDLSKKTTHNETAYHLACISGNDKVAKWITKNSDELKINLNEKPCDLMSVFEDDKYMQEFFRCRARKADCNVTVMPLVGWRNGF